MRELPILLMGDKNGALYIDKDQEAFCTGFHDPYCWTSTFVPRRVWHEHEQQRKYRKFKFE
jgi:hypothetical protein